MIRLYVRVLTDCSGKDKGSEEWRAGHYGDLGEKGGGTTLVATGGRGAQLRRENRRRRMLDAQHWVLTSSTLTDSSPFRLLCPSGCNQLPVQRSFAILDSRAVAHCLPAPITSRITWQTEVTVLTKNVSCFSLKVGLAHAWDGSRTTCWALVPRSGIVGSRRRRRIRPPSPCHEKGVSRCGGCRPLPLPFLQMLL